MSNSNAPRFQRDIQLDFLRGIAILLVLFYHSTLHNTALGWLGPVLDPVISFGWTGVNLFFVLSGFLVGGLIFKEIRATGRVDARRFLIRRAFKIWPAYFVFIGYYFLKLHHRKESIRQVFLQLWPNLLQVQNYFPSPPQHTWSLAVEEHFYLAFAIFVVFLMRGQTATGRRLKIIPWAALGLLVVCLGLRLLNWNTPFESYTHMWETHLCVDSLFLGVCLAYLYHFHPAFFERWASRRLWLGLFAVAAIAPMFFISKSTPFVFTFGMTLLSLGFGCLLVSVVPLPSRSAPPARFWSHKLVKLVAWVGIYSYSIYLWHLDLVTQPIFFLMGPMWKYEPSTSLAALYLSLHIGGSVLVGVIMAKVIEFPALHLRERLMPASGRRQGSQPAAPASVPPADGGRLPSMDSLS